MVTLVKVNEEYKEEALEFKKEFFDCNETVINGSALFDQLSFDDWMDLVKKNENIETVSKDWAVSSVFFLMLESKIIGITEIRHSLTTPFLQEYAGHIGYSIRPSYRKKGYGTKLLSLAKDYCREIGLKEIRLGCYCDNVGSIRVIENNQGICIKKKEYLDGKLMYIYEIKW
ncbi:GNAT family N-acetyltransferase [Floccifex porci]|uniref:GNAT family N-acetyltransferase n=1 Tax=Floccifex porci TaxID=2606629 RepID=A0A7X2T505_9FIRM|nr:GNAT family N-acetyltransferase [Floccifex porci]MSS02361.1 GNAT family N-acetyltransferase [Floccifex porci]